MLSRTLISLLLLSVAAPSPARRPRHTHETTDPQTRLHTLTLELTASACPNSPTPPLMDVHVLLSAHQLQPRDVAWFLTTDLEFGPILHPGKHGTLDASVDGVHFQLLPSGPKVKWSQREPFQRGRHIREMVPFDAPPDFLHALASAANFRFQLNATDGIVERCISSKRLRDVRGFVDYASAY